MPRLRKQNVCAEAYRKNDSSWAQKSPVVSVVQEISEHGTGGVRRERMYIPEFIVGMLVGAALTLVVLVALALRDGKKK